MSRHHGVHTIKWTVTQKGTQNGKGCEVLPNGKLGPMQNLSVSIGTKTCHAYRPLMPQIKFTYHTDSKAKSSGGSTATRSEIYTFIDGEYRMTYIHMVE